MMSRRGGPTFEDEFPDLLRIAQLVAWRIVRDHEDADDIAIEALARASLRWSNVREYAPRWIVRVTTNLAVDHLRRARSIPLPRESVASPMDAVEDRMWVSQMLSTLSRRQRDVIVLTYLCDKSAEESAALLGISSGAVKQHGHRAIASLRERHLPHRPHEMETQCSPA